MSSHLEAVTDKTGGVAQAFASVKGVLRCSVSTRMRPVTGSPEGMTCPECGGPVDVDNAFGQPFCARCDKYY